MAGPPPHTHPDEEVFYVLEGEFEFMLNGALIPAIKGSVIHIPSGELHNYKNTGAKSGKLLTVVTPGLLAGFFQAVGQPVRSAHDIPDLDKVPDFAGMNPSQFIALAPSHDITLHL